MSGSGIPLTCYPGSRRILFVGGGSAAAAKLRALQPHQPGIRLVAPHILPSTIEALQGFPGSDVRKRKFRRRDTAGIALAYIFTDNHTDNRRIAAICRRRGIPVNCASRPGTPSGERIRNRDFSSPAACTITTHSQDTFTIAVSSDGRSVQEAVRLRNHIQILLKESFL